MHTIRTSSLLLLFLIASTLACDDDDRQPAEALPPLAQWEWTRISIPVTPIDPDGKVLLSAVVAGGPGLVAVGQDSERAAVWISADGFTWERIPHNDAVFGNGVSNLLFGGQRMNRVVAAGSGLIAFGHDGGTPAIWTSPDGLTWLRVALVESVFPDNARIAAMVEHQTGVFAVGSIADTAAVWRSDDGETWERIDAQGLGAGNDINSLTARNGRIVAAGSRGDVLMVWHTPDGRAWERIEPGRIEPPLISPTSHVWDLTTVGNTFVAVGEDGPKAAVWYSQDGERWEYVSRDQPMFGGQINDIVASEAGLVAVGSDATFSVFASRAVAWVSQDRRTWARVFDPVAFDEVGLNEEGATMDSVAFGGPGLVAVGSGMAGAAGEGASRHRRRCRDPAITVLGTRAGCCRPRRGHREGRHGRCGGWRARARRGRAHRRAGDSVAFPGRSRMDAGAYG